MRSRLEGAMKTKTMTMAELEALLSRLREAGQLDSRWYEM